MEITTAEQAKETILKWLKENHHQIEDYKDQNAHFHFEIDFPVGTMKKERIIQPNDYPQLILVLNGVSIAPEHAEHLKKMKDDEREGFYNEIRKDLMFSDVSYDLNLDPEGIAKQVQFSYEFYFDGLTKTQLYKALLMNYRVLLYFVTKFNDKFGIPEMKQAPETLNA